MFDVSMKAISALVELPDNWLSLVRRQNHCYLFNLYRHLCERTDGINVLIFYRLQKVFLMEATPD